MMTKSSFRFVTVFSALLLFTAACNTPAKEEKTAEAAKPDMTQIRAEIQAIENEWAKASTAKDIARVMSFYADDAVEMNDDEPMSVGKPAIEAALTKSMMKHKAGSTVTFETLDVFGSADQVTEVGKITVKDSTDKVISAGKYIGIFEKRDGKYVCIRDISNDDQKDK